MSFFGFDEKSRGHPTQNLGFGATPDPFANISRNREDDDDAIEFDDTYDGLGDQLEEADDNFNDDTFGGGGTSTKPPGRDFDFYGSTNQVSDAINEEAIRYNRQQPPPKPLVSSAPSRPAGKPFKTGYEAYEAPEYMPNLQADATLWGTATSIPAATHSNPTYGSGGAQSPDSSVVPGKKMMSLEEVEAAMRSQPRKPTPVPPLQQQTQVPSAPTKFTHMPPQQPQESHTPQMQILQHHPERPVRPQGFAAPQVQPKRRASQQYSHHAPRSPVPQVELPVRTNPVLPPVHAPQVLHRIQNLQHHAPDTGAHPQPRQILQNPNRQPAQLIHKHPMPPVAIEEQPRMLMTNHDGRQVPLPIITHPSQLEQLSEEQRQAFLVEDAKRAKRNHKIYLLSKDNGLMTPQDKNFITRIQLQQLMTATGSVNEQDPDASLSEDFYYQVYNQIENRPRQNPHQPLSNFAQTYLFQTGGSQGGINRRHQNRGDNHMHRMQQQVQRAVEAAKAKPKNKQLIIEGSLGKISFSNAKTPKPLLNIKRHDSSDVSSRVGSKKPQATLSTTDRKAILKNIEAVYSTLMKMEDHDRRVPPQPTGENDPESMEPFIEWRQTFQALNQKLWSELKVMEPIMPEDTVLHPFIAFLSYPKGKKAIPRIFGHIDQEQRLTILTILMVQLDTLDVIRSGRPEIKEGQSPTIAREQIDVFLQAVMPSLFSYVTEAPLNIVIGLLGLVIERVNLHAITRTRVGLEILTMFLSQAEIIRKAEAANDDEWQQWLDIYNRLFDTVEPILVDIFPRSVSAGQDVYVWQFLATIGTGANPEQQQRLVLAVKDRVMETVQQSKTLPPEMAAQRRGNVNLFMQAIGLDVDMLDG